MIPPTEIAKLWRAHSAALELLARSRCGTPEDCVQEAFIRLSQQLELPRDPHAWLARTVRNHAIDSLRMAGRRQRREREFAQRRQQWFEPITEIVETDWSGDVIEALLRLDLDDRELVTAHIWGGLTFRQLAEVFEQPSSTLHRRYLAALARLKEILTVRQG